MTTVQQQIKQKITELGLPFKEVEVYGRQIVVTSYCESTAHRWASLLSKFAKVRGVTESIDYAKENKGTCLLPSAVRVWRTFAAIQ